MKPIALACLAVLSWHGVALGQTPGSPPAEAPPVALPWVVALVMTIVLLLIVCMPSRKG